MQMEKKQNLSETSEFIKTFLQKCPQQHTCLDFQLIRTLPKELTTRSRSQEFVFSGEAHGFIEAIQPACLVKYKCDGCDEIIQEFPCFPVFHPHSRQRYSSLCKQCANEFLKQ